MRFWPALFALLLAASASASFVDAEKNELNLKLVFVGPGLKGPAANLQ